VKRSSKIKLLLAGGLAAGALASCGPNPTRVSTENVYVNDQQVPGAGYYHAPFHAFFNKPYNFYDAGRRQYYYGGLWGSDPYQSIINISAPTPEAARAAEAARTDIVRGGFGSTAHGRSVYS